jgi:hypothetical protein
MKALSAALARMLPALVTALLLSACAQMPTPGSSAVPDFKVDPAWPQPLAEKNGVQLIFDQVAGIAVDPRSGHIWAIHRPASLVPDERDPKTNKPVTHRCCEAMPPVAEFDAQGKYLRGWGPTGTGFDWPKVEHGIYIDDDGNVRIAGNAAGDNQVLKFSPDGKFLMQIGQAGQTEGSNSTAQLGQPAHMMVSKGELLVADGYGNRRVIVFDAAIGAYKRHWGAYGGRPSDDKLPAYDPAQPPARQFGNPVHCVRMSHEDLLYVCDRTNNRIQVFTRAGEFKWIHNIAIDDDGNLYTAEVGFGRRVQKFVRGGGGF